MVELLTQWPALGFLLAFALVATVALILARYVCGDRRSRGAADEFDVINASPTPFLLIRSGDDRAPEIRVINAAAERLFHADRPTLAVTDLPMDWRPAPASGEPVTVRDVVIGGTSAQPTTRWYDVRSYRVSHDTEALEFHDVTDRRHSIEASLRAAMTDPLTGLVGRTEAVAHLTQLVDEGHGVAVMMLDLDGFKPVNDLHGHLAGDEVLQVVSKRIEQSLKERDLVARFGGDEFVCVLKGPLTDEEIEQIEDRLTSAVGATIRLRGGTPVQISMSIGTVYTEQIADVDDLIDCADQRMYAHKHSLRFRPERSMTRERGDVPIPGSLGEQRW